MNWRDYRNMFWRQRGIFIRCLILLIMMAFLFLWMKKPEYTVTMMIGPTSQNGAAAVGVRAPSDSEIAPSLAEHVASESLSDYARYVQLLTSRDVADQLIDETPSLMPTLFPSEWDAKNQRWHFPWTPRSVVKQVAAFLTHRSGWHAPDAERLAAYLDRHIVITPLAGSPMRKISFRHSDKGLAVNVVLGLHHAADGILRNEAARRSDAIINYITKQLGTISIAEHREALTHLMAEQERARLLVAVDLPYAADMIAPPSAPDDADWPNPSIVIGFAIFMALLIGSCLAFFHEWWQSRKKPVLMLVRKVS